MIIPKEKAVHTCNEQDEAEIRGWILPATHRRRNEIVRTQMRIYKIATNAGRIQPRRRHHAARLMKLVIHNNCQIIGSSNSAVVPAAHQSPVKQDLFYILMTIQRQKIRCITLRHARIRQGDIRGARACGHPTGGIADIGGLDRNIRRMLQMRYKTHATTIS